MLDHIMAFFTNKTEMPLALTVDESAAVLLIEVMLADNEVDRRERDCISQILAQRTGDSAAAVDACIDLALERRHASSDLFQFTTVLNDQWSEQQRYQLVVDLWRVAYADGRLDKHEDHRIRRVADLLHLHHSHFIRAKAAASSRSVND
ncbi:TerB family tellurite resistance protein [Reinekea sp.]|jgi:uncharacterized tellurite resistance protein B-like protein|uniref:tellurite resistance TerB family protein n=1 Tax=Reinekea sp. TaxID=1970455 RepID=UPI002A808474|nr:TerB family tellurite resistance protein [Reinekea sp.]